MLQSDTQLFIINELNDLYPNKAWDKKVHWFNQVLFFLNYLFHKTNDFKMISQKLNDFCSGDLEITALLENGLFIEVFLKSIIQLLNKTPQRDLINCMFECNLFDDSLRYEDGHPKFNVSYGINNKKYYENIFNKAQKEYYYASAYECRNIKSHELPILALRKQVRYLDGILLVFLNVSWTYRSKLIIAFKKKVLNADSYISELKTIINEKSLIEYYVPANGIVDSKKISVKKFIDDKADGRKHKKILGQAGIGKTTTMRYLVKNDLDHFEKEGVLPIYIELMYFTKENETINSFIIEKLGLESDIIEKLFHFNSFKIYLDGINEISCTSKTTKNITINIEKFIKSHTSTFILLSDRENNYLEIMNGEPEFHICKLDDEQIIDFINKNAKASKKEEIASYVNTHEAIKDTIRIPYFLKTLIEIISNNIDVPDKEELFVGALLDAIIKRESTEKFDNRVHRLKQLFMRLSLLDDDFSENELIIEIRKCFPDEFDIEGIIRLCVQMGIIENNKGNYCFANNKYKDCYFAEAISNDI